ncbi:hypothetical protein Hanom_Chr01g00074481 [Helianthus anomalus]
MFKGFTFATRPRSSKLNINKHVRFPLLQNPSFCGDFCCFSSGCFISSAHCCKTILNGSYENLPEVVRKETEFKELNMNSNVIRIALTYGKRMQVLSKGRKQVKEMAHRVKL